MVKYNCERCGYSTKYKGNFRSHLHRKTTCLPILADIDINILREKFENTKNIYKNGGTPMNPHFYPHKPPFLTKSSESSEFVPPQNPHFYPHFQLNNPHFYPHFTPIFNSNSQLQGVLDFSSKSEIGQISEDFEDFEVVPNLSKNAKNSQKKSEKNFSKKMKKNLIKNKPKNDEFLLCDEDQKLRCKFCNKKFSSIKNRYRHQKHHCKVRKGLQKYKEPVDDSPKNLEDEIKALKREIRDLKSCPTINVEKQQNIGRQQNIIINNYRSENIDYITDRVLETIVKRGPYASIPRLIETIHFNKKHPENHNLAITNAKSKFAHIRTNNTWQVKFLNELLEELVNTKFNIIDEYYELGGLKERLHSWKADSYETYRKEMLSKNSELRDKIKLKLFESIINFTKVLGLTQKIK